MSLLYFLCIGYGIIVEGGGFEEGSELNLEFVTEEQVDEVFDLLENSGIALDDDSKAYIYDIFVTKDGSEIQPNGNVKVTVPAPVDEKATGYNVYHVKDNGAVVSIPATYKDGKIIFETDGFSYYVFTATYNIITYGLKSSVTIDTATITNGTVSVEGEQVNGLYREFLDSGSTISLSAKANEGYELYCWFIQGARTDTKHEEEFVYTVTAEDVSITAVFKPIITELSLTHFDETFVYDLDLAKDAETLTVEQFCHERPAGEYYLVAGILEHFSGNGRITIRDEHNNVIQAELSDGIITTETYVLLRNKINKFVAVYGLKDEDSNFKMTNATLSAFIPDFSKEQIKGVSVEGLNVIDEGVYLIEGNEENEIDWETPGEYVVTYYLASNPEIYKTVTVIVLGKSVEFTAWANNGTILLDGADIGSQYNSKFRNGYGKITLTAKSDENTVFKGWYLLEGNDNILVSENPTYTFEFNEETFVWCEFEYVASEIILDGMNSGFDTYHGETEIYLPLDEGRTFDLTQIGVCAMINGEPVYLTLDDYTIDADGFDGTNPTAGVYEVTFTYNDNPDIKATHVIHVFGEEGAVSLDAYRAVYRGIGEDVITPLTFIFTRNDKEKEDWIGCYVEDFKSNFTQFTIMSEEEDLGMIDASIHTYIYRISELPYKMGSYILEGNEYEKESDTYKYSNEFCIPNGTYTLETGETFTFLYTKPGSIELFQYINGDIIIEGTITIAEDKKTIYLYIENDPYNKVTNADKEHYDTTFGIYYPPDFYLRGDFSNPDYIVINDLYHHTESPSEIEDIMWVFGTYNKMVV